MYNVPFWCSFTICKFTITKLLFFYTGIIQRVTSAILTNASYIQTWIWRQMSQVSGWSIQPLGTMATLFCPKWIMVTQWTSVTHGKPQSTSKQSPTLSWCVVCYTLHATSTKKLRRFSTRLTRLQGKKDSTLEFNSRRWILTFILLITALWTGCYTLTATPIWFRMKLCFSK